ncbi:MAG: hypothetical protein J5871_00730 [Bacteroidales bacterium]|nr:hypothetical protein [Bacteroidales bacterium]
MLARRLFLALFLLSAVLPLKAQELRCRSILLEKMVAALSASAELDTLRDGLHYAALTRFGEPLTVRKKGGMVEHIGFSLLGPASREAYPQAIVDFLERYPLVLKLALDKERSSARKMLEDGVECVEGDLSGMVHAMCADALSQETTLENIGGKWYCFHWKCRSGGGKLVFPIDYQLISGRDMQENENALPREILEAASPLPACAVPADAPDGEPGIFAAGGSSYYFETLSSSRYFRKSPDGGISPVLDSGEFIPYCANLFTGAGVPNTLTLSVKMRKYGLASSYFSVPLDQWISFGFAHGCEPYWGIVSLSDDMVEGELILHNEACGYDHVLHVWADKTAVRQGRGTIQGRLVPYIPLHSLRYLFEEIKK